MRLYPVSHRCISEFFGGRNAGFEAVDDEFGPCCLSVDASEFMLAFFFGDDFAISFKRTEELFLAFGLGLGM